MAGISVLFLSPSGRGKGTKTFFWERGRDERDRRDRTRIQTVPIKSKISETNGRYYKTVGFFRPNILFPTVN